MSHRDPKNPHEPPAGVPRLIKLRLAALALGFDPGTFRRRADGGKIPLFPGERYKDRYVPVTYLMEKEAAGAEVDWDLIRREIRQ